MRLCRVTLILALGAGATGVGIIPPGPGPGMASAQERRTGVLEEVRSRCLAAIDRRVEALTAVAAGLGTVRPVTDEHRAALVQQLDGSKAALASIRLEVVNAGDAATLRTACQAVAEDQRVYALVLPRTRLVVVADRLVAVCNRLSAAADRLEAAIIAFDGKKDVTTARATLAMMRTSVHVAETAASGLPAELLALTPADWNADRTVLLPARNALGDARKVLVQARQKAKETIAALRG
jgi:hypothetical protein